MADSMPKKNPASRRCLLTGGSGYVGGRIKSAIEAAGWEVTDLARRAGDGSRAIRFQLGEQIAPERLAGFSALVHCAYDGRLTSWRDIHATNVVGSEFLLRAAREAGIKRIVFISSISAFEGCRSLYGRAKTEIESVARDVGAAIIRPGLVYGDHPGGVFGGLVKQVKRSRVVPLLGGGAQRQFLVHDEDLARLVNRCIAGEIPPPREPITLAHEEGLTMRQLLNQLASALGKRLTFLPVPWRLVWLGLKSLELFGLPAPFRSDSLIGLVYQNPSPSFRLAKSLGAGCRPSRVTTAMLK